MANELEVVPAVIGGGISAVGEIVSKAGEILAIVAEESPVIAAIAVVGGITMTAILASQLIDSKKE